jgi:hypothetical protein
MIKVDADKLLDCFRQDVKWTLAFHYQLSSVSELDLDCVHHLPYALL